MTWQDACSAVLGGRRDRCDVHDKHDLRTVTVNLGRRPVPDCPAAVPGAAPIEMLVFDADRYREPGYCTGDDEVSRSLIAQGAWEPWETAVAWAILADPAPGVMLDLGCHVGWYLLLAAFAGREGLGVAADVEQVAAANGSLIDNGMIRRAHARPGWIERGMLPFPLGDERVRLAKIDVEGAELAAVCALAPALAAGAVDFLLIETGPEFGAESVAGLLASAGYEPRLVPTKGDDLDAYEADPLGVILASPVCDPDALPAQRTILWSRGR